MKKKEKVVQTKQSNTGVKDHKPNTKLTDIGLTLNSGQAVPTLTEIFDILEEYAADKKEFRYSRMGSANVAFTIPTNIARVLDIKHKDHSKFLLLPKGIIILRNDKYLIKNNRKPKGRLMQSKGIDEE